MIEQPALGEICSSKLDHFPNFRGENSKKSSKPPSGTWFLWGYRSITPTHDAFLRHPWDKPRSFMNSTPKFNSSGGWKTILSYWEGNFSGYPQKKMMKSSHIFPNLCRVKVFFFKHWSQCFRWTLVSGALQLKGKGCFWRLFTQVGNTSPHVIFNKKNGSRNIPRDITGSLWGFPPFISLASPFFLDMKFPTTHQKLNGTLPTDPV